MNCKFLDKRRTVSIYNEVICYHIYYIFYIYIYKNKLYNICIYIYKITFWKRELWLAKSRVSITACMERFILIIMSFDCDVACAYIWLSVWWRRILMWHGYLLPFDSRQKKLAYAEKSKPACILTNDLKMYQKTL